MKTLARTLLVWFVLLALPFQGFAAAAMRCAHGVAHTPATAIAITTATAQHGHAAVPPCHETAPQAAAPGHDIDAGQDTCGNCAACSVGAVIAPAFADAVTAPPARGPCPPAAIAALAASDPDLPERPPKTRFA